MTTLSIIKADTGGFVGHTAVHPDMIGEAECAIDRARGDLSLIMTHAHGANARAIHTFAWDFFVATTEIARGLGLYGAGQDLLSDAFARDQANEVMDYLRRHGPFEPHRLGLEEMEYTTLSSVGARLADRWQPLDDMVAAAEEVPIGAGPAARS